MKKKITDKQRLDWLQSKSNYSMWIARESLSRRGFRLPNTTEHGYPDGARGTARKAIDAAMRREKPRPE